VAAIAAARRPAFSGRASRSRPLRGKGLPEGKKTSRSRLCSAPRGPDGRRGERRAPQIQEEISKTTASRSGIKRREQARRPELDHIANLARIELTAEEKERFATQLGTCSPTSRSSTSGHPGVEPNGTRVSRRQRLGGGRREPGLPWTTRCATRRNGAATCLSCPRSRLAPNKRARDLCHSTIANSRIHGPGLPLRGRAHAAVIARTKQVDLVSAPSTPSTPTPWPRQGLGRASGKGEASGRRRTASPRGDTDRHEGRDLVAASPDASSRCSPGFVHPMDATSTRKLKEAGAICWAAQPRRVRDGLLDGEFGVRDDIEPVDLGPRAWRLIGRKRGGGAPASDRLARLDTGIDPPARGPL